MNNDEAMEALVSKRSRINTAINDLNRFIIRESENWEVISKLREMAALKIASTAGGVDLSDWNGQPAPVPAPDGE